MPFLGPWAWATGFSSPSVAPGTCLLSATSVNIGCLHVSLFYVTFKYRHPVLHNLIATVPGTILAWSFLHWLYTKSIPKWMVENKCFVIWKIFSLLIYYVAYFCMLNLWNKKGNLTIPLRNWGIYDLCLEHCPFWGPSVKLTSSSDSVKICKIRSTLWTILVKKKKSVLLCKEKKWDRQTLQNTKEYVSRLCIYW